MIFNPNVGGQQMVTGGLYMSGYSTVSVIYDDGHGGAKVVAPLGDEITVRKNSILAVVQEGTNFSYSPREGAQEQEDLEVAYEDTHVRYYYITGDFRIVNG